MRRSLPILALATSALGGCAAVDGPVSDRPDLLSPPRQAEVLSETLLREGLRKDGCLAPGNGRDRSDRCESLRDFLAPPPLPEPIEVSPPPASDDDD
ncbi:hypothetical protein GRI62_01990 [Erythrobacter arachoides]|uniref:Lipoprotein n=1 Tax=Aurantiacibacter arachoides TaxID=1850444 RepID=A0A844ZWV8_9SPHN|nr:hypothetical protein [Aurantiacibacter arachoides]MXO92375.1 hypothetical protein [Aurantiacibacter arachoides]GGD57668.1 hypothetical protein GCM10011411_17140 [Aurantiacibacter arachoides]